MFSIIVCLHYLNTLIKRHFYYFHDIVYLYNINILIFCQYSNHPLVHLEIDLPGREKTKPFPVFPVFFGIGEVAWEGLVLGMHRVDAAAKKEAGPDEFL